MLWVSMSCTTGWLLWIKPSEDAMVGQMNGAILEILLTLHLALLGGFL